VYTDEEMLPGAALRGDWPGSEKKPSLSDQRMSKDEIFKNESRPIGDFSFNEEVATVFDDMLNRSVHYYLVAVK
jgi:hypothetical protein